MLAILSAAALAACGHDYGMSAVPAAGSTAIVLLASSAEENNNCTIYGVHCFGVTFAAENKDAFRRKDLVHPAEGNPIPVNEFYAEFAPPRNGSRYWEPVRLTERSEKLSAKDVLVKVTWNRLPGWSKWPAYNLGYRFVSFSEYLPSPDEEALLNENHWQNIPIRVYVQPDGRIGVAAILKP